MIPFDEIPGRLKSLGKDRHWLAVAANRSENSIRAALAPNAPPPKRSELLQRILSDAIEAEETTRESAKPATQNIPPGYSAIFLDDEELDLADQASRIIAAPSLAAFCHDVIQAEARRIIQERIKMEAAAPLASLPDPEEHWIDIVGGIAAGAKISGDDIKQPIQVSKEYPKDHYALRVFGRSMEPAIPDGSIIVVRKLPEGTRPKKGQIVAYSDGHGSSLKEFGYRKARPDEHPDAMGNVPVLRSLNEDFADLPPMDGGKIEAIHVATIPTNDFQAAPF